MTFPGEQIVEFATTFGIKVIGAIVILVVGRFAAGLGRRLMRKALQRAEVDKAVEGFVTRLTYFLILVFAVLAALAAFGIQTTSFLAVLGSAGLAIGLALQGSLSNFAAGVLILVLKPYRIGDYIEGAGVAGTVQAIQLFTTALTTPDNVKILAPNGKIFGDVIKNYSAHETRRADLVVGIGYGSDIQRAQEVIMGLLKEDARILPEPEPVIAVSELADSSVNLVIRPWVKRADLWPVKFDLTRRIKEAFDANGIEIPFPQRTVHMASDGT